MLESMTLPVLKKEIWFLSSVTTDDILLDLVLIWLRSYYNFLIFLYNVSELFSEFVSLAIVD